MLAHLLLAAVATLFAAEPAKDQGLGAFVLRHGTTHSVTSYYTIHKVYDEPNDFLWVHYDGVDYVTHDAATIEEFARLEASIPRHSEKRRELQHQLRAAQRDRDRLHTRSITAPSESERRAAADALPPIEADVRTIERQIDAVDEELRNAQNEAAAKLGRLVDSAVRTGLAIRVQQ